MRSQKIFSGEANRKFFEYEVVLSMNEKVLELIIKQYEQCRTPEVVAAIQEQDKLSRIMRDKKAEFDKYKDQSVEFLRIGTEKFFEKIPEYKESLFKGETKLDIVGNALDIALNNPNKLEKINSKMKEIEELRKNEELTPLLTQSLYEYMVAFSDFEIKLKEDREKLFSSEYKDKMAAYADEGILLYYLETPDIPLLNSEINGCAILESLCCDDCTGLQILLSPLLQMDNPGISMKRKQEDIFVTIELINSGFYRSAVRNLFALLDSEHKKAANAYEGIIEKKHSYKKGLQRANKIDKLINSLDDLWMETAWDKVNKYYAKVVSTNPVEGVIHRNSIVHGDYDKELIEVDEFSAAKLILLWLNLRLIADYLCNKEEILDNLLLYLPSLILHLKDNPS